MTSWSKLFRREFLAGLGVSFAAGIHEDILVTFAALLNADVIGGSARCATATAGSGRARRWRPPVAARSAVFDAYDRVFELLAGRAAAGHPASAALRAAVFERAIEHYSNVLETTGRGSAGSAARAGAAS